jgi:hypothetical protein
MSYIGHSLVCLVLEVSQSPTYAPVMDMRMKELQTRRPGLELTSTGGKGLERACTGEEDLLQRFSLKDSMTI